VPAIDVIIPTFNRPDSLRRCLEALSRQTFTDFRVTVIDDHSPTPAEGGIAESLRSLMDVRFLRLDENSGPAKARNAGLRMADARYIAFIDDDVVAAPELLERHMAAANADPMAVITGPMAAPEDWRPTPWNEWEWLKLEQQYAEMEAGVFEPTWRQFYTGNAFVPLDALRAAGLFDERFTRAEDIELAYRLAQVGCTFACFPDAIGWHHAERSLESWMAIPDAYGMFEVAIAQLHPECDWLENLQADELPSRRFARVRETLARHPLLGTALAHIAARMARPLARAGLSNRAQQLLSLSYDLAYRISLTKALSSASPVLAGPAIKSKPLRRLDKSIEGQP